jgi:hypothetical protein
MTLADQAAIGGHDGQVGSSRPKRRTFTAAYIALTCTGHASPDSRGGTRAKVNLVARSLEGASPGQIPGAASEDHGSCWPLPPGSAMVDRYWRAGHLYPYQAWSGPSAVMV